MTIGAETNEIWSEVVDQSLDYEIDQLRHGEKGGDGHGRELEVVPSWATS